jgi:hypothetical protein
MTVTTVTVVVRAPFQVTHDGFDYGPGETAEVPTEVAEDWEKRGLADLAPRRSTGSGSRARAKVTKGG